MIIRQVVVRNGRTAIRPSAHCYRRNYASEISELLPAQQQLARNKQTSQAIPSRPSDPSSILDSSSLPPTAATRAIADSIVEISKGVSQVRSDVNAHIAATQGGSIDPTSSHSSHAQSQTPASYHSLADFVAAREQSKRLSKVGSHIKSVYHPDHLISNPPYPSTLTLPMLLANQTHLGHATSLWNPANSSYIFGIRDGIHIISLEVTLAYLRRAIKVVREVARRGGIVLFVGTRKGQQDIIVTAARLAGGYHIFDRWVPGCLTNGQQLLAGCAVKVVNRTDQEIPKYREMLTKADHAVLRPDLVICLNPLENEVCLHECALYNVPTIGIIDTDANPALVTYPIPANDDSLRSSGLIAGVLGRAGQEGQRLRKESAAKGDLTFDTRHVQAYLEGLEEMSSMDVQEKTSETSSQT